MNERVASGDQVHQGESDGDGKITPQSQGPELGCPLRPLLGWAPRYERRWLRPDLIAGLTVTALVVPKALGYAGIARQDGVIDRFGRLDIGCLLRTRFPRGGGGAVRSMMEG
jgi:hypothetical protein